MRILVNNKNSLLVMKNPSPDLLSALPHKLAAQDLEPWVIVQTPTADDELPEMFLVSSPTPSERVRAVAAFETVIRERHQVPQMYLTFTDEKFSTISVDV